MKLMKTALLPLLLIILAGNFAFADENNKNVGTSAFNFLKIQIGARPMAMGGAFPAMVCFPTGDQMEQQPGLTLVIN